MSNGNGLPPIRLTESDRARLQRLSQASMERFPETADYLAREIERARVVAPDHVGFVRMGSWVEFRDDRTGQVRRVVLVYPDQADVSAGRISVMTPIGAALIGLSDGQSIEWRTPAGEARSLTVVGIGDAAEEGGAPHAEESGAPTALPPS